MQIGEMNISDNMLCQFPEIVDQNYSRKFLEKIREQAPGNYNLSLLAKWSQDKPIDFEVFRDQAPFILFIKVQHCALYFFTFEPLVSDRQFDCEGHKAILFSSHLRKSYSISGVKNKAYGFATARNEQIVLGLNDLTIDLKKNKINILNIFSQSWKLSFWGTVSSLKNLLGVTKNSFELKSLEIFRMERIEGTRLESLRRICNEDGTKSKEIEQLRKRVNELQNDVKDRQRMKPQKLVSVEVLNKLQSDLQSRDRLIIQLYRKLQELNETLTVENAAQEGTVKQLQEQIETLTVENAAQEGTVKQLQEHQLNILQQYNPTQIDQLNAVINTITLQKQDLKQTHQTELQNITEQFEIDKQVLKSQHQTQIQQLQERISQLENAKEVLSTNLEKSKRDKQSMSIKIVNLQSEVKRCNEQLEEDGKQIDNLNAAIKTQQAEFCHLKFELNQKSFQIDRLNGRIEFLSSEMSKQLDPKANWDVKYKQAIQNSSKFRAQLKDKESQLCQKNKIIVDLQRHIEVVIADSSIVLAKTASLNRCVYEDLQPIQALTNISRLSSAQIVGTYCSVDHFHNLLLSQIVQTSADKNLLFRTLLQLHPNKKLVQNRLLYSSQFQDDNFHSYINNKPNLLLLIQFPTNYIVAIYWEQELIQGQNCFGKTFLLSLTNKKVYYTKKQQEVEPTVSIYNEFMLIFGSSEFNLNMKEKQLEITLMKNSLRSFDLEGENDIVNTLSGQSSNAVPVKAYEIFQAKLQQ